MWKAYSEYSLTVADGGADGVVDGGSIAPAGRVRLSLFFDILMGPESFCVSN